MLTILHAADLHLDSPFRSLPPQEAARRREEQRDCLRALRDIALEHHVRLCLLSGDLFDSKEVYPETVELLARTLGELPCPVCISPGNHDPYTPTSPYAAHPWPGNVHIFSEEAVAAVPFPELGVTVYGCAFTSPAREDDPLSGFHAAEDGTIPIGVFHGEVGAGSRYAPISPDSLARSGLVYAALGHIHQGSGLQRAGETCWACPGCPQGRGFDELGDKGALLVTVDGDVSARFVPVPGPRYLHLTVSVHENPEKALEEVRPEDYLRLTLTGECEPLDLAALRMTLEGRCRYLELRDETTPPADVWSRAGEETLTGLFLKELQTLDVPKELMDRAARYGLAALEGREEPR